MRTLRRLRPFAAFLVVVTLLFGQLAVAAYACPGAQTMAAAAFVPMDDMPDCDRMPDSQRDALCQAHCQQGDQSRDTPSAALPPLALAAGPTLLVAAREEAGEPGPPQDFFLARRLEPPASIRHCRLHI